MIRPYICNVKLSKRLRQLSVKQKSIFYWFDWSGNKDYICCLKRDFAQVGFPNNPLSAFTVAELGAIISENYTGDWYSEFFAGIWYCRLHTHNVKDSCTLRLEANCEADSRAKLLIYLIEENIISLEKINNKREN